MARRPHNESAIPRPDRRAIPVLDGIRVSWEWLCAGPHPVTVAGAEIAGVADRPIPLDELRAQMLDRGTDPVVRDAVWAYLITRSRRDGPTWTIACAGMALPMLAGVCRELTGRFAGDRSDICSAVVTGFVAALAEIDPARSGLVTSLRWSALRGGHAAVREALDAPAPHPHDRLVHAALTGTPPTALTRTALTRRAPGGDGDNSGAEAAGAVGSAPQPPRGGHPDLVLAEAVAAGVITVVEAGLIGETRLEGTPLVAVAARWERPVGAVTMQRLRAEMRLVDHLQRAQNPDPEPGSEPGSESGRSTRRRRVRRSHRVSTTETTEEGASETRPPQPTGVQSPPVTVNRRRWRTRGGVSTGERGTR